MFWVCFALGWLGLAAGLGVLVGKGIKLADEQRPQC